MTTQNAIPPHLQDRTRSALDAAVRTETGFAWESSCGDGYDFINESAPGWTSISGWGLDGWNMGDWPLVVVQTRKLDSDVDAPWEMRTYVEGDLTTHSFKTRSDLIAALDQTALFYWRHLGHGPEAARSEPANQHPEWSGPFSWERLNTQRAIEGLCALWHGTAVVR